MFYDLNDQVPPAYRFPLRSEQTKPMQCKIDCVNKILRATNVPNISVMAKHEDDIDFVDLVVDGLDLSEWAGSREIFDIEFTAGIITARSLEDLYFYLT